MATLLSKIHFNLLPGSSSNASSKSVLPKENFKEKLASHSQEKVVIPEGLLLSNNKVELAQEEKSVAISEIFTLEKLVLAGGESKLPEEEKLIGMSKLPVLEKLFSASGESKLPEEEKLIGMSKLSALEELFSADGAFKLAEEEKEKRIVELLEKGETPYLHELAFFLGTDNETLTEALEKSDLNWLLVLLGKNEVESNFKEKILQETSSQTKQKSVELANKAVQFFQPFFTQAALKENYTETKSLQRQKAFELAFSHYQIESSSLNSGTGEETGRVLQAESNYAFSQTMSKAEQYAFHTQPKSALLNAEQFAEKLTSIFQKAALSHMPSGSKLLIKLYPEQLGSLRVELLQQDGLMTAKFVSSTQAVKELIEQNVHQLKQALSQQSLKIEQIEVSSLPEKPLHDKEQHEQKHQHRNKEQAAAFTEEEAAFETILFELELEV